jgi:hypothetical protein
MDSVEDIGIGEERAQAGLGAEIDRPASIPGAGEVGRVRVTEDPPAEGDEAGVFLAI